MIVYSNLYSTLFNYDYPSLIADYTKEDVKEKSKSEFQLEIYSQSDKLTIRRNLTVFPKYYLEPEISADNPRFFTLYGYKGVTTSVRIKDFYRGLTPKLVLAFTPTLKKIYTLFPIITIFKPVLAGTTYHPIIQSSFENLLQVSISASHIYFFSFTHELITKNEPVKIFCLNANLNKKTLENCSSSLPEMLPEVSNNKIAMVGSNTFLTFRQYSGQTYFVLYSNILHPIHQTKNLTHIFDPDDSLVSMAFSYNVMRPLCNVLTYGNNLKLNNGFYFMLFLKKNVNLFTLRLKQEKVYLPWKIIKAYNMNNRENLGIFLCQNSTKKFLYVCSFSEVPLSESILALDEDVTEFLVHDPRVVVFTATGRVFVYELRLPRFILLF